MSIFNDKVKSRLVNWKFERAAKVLLDADVEDMSKEAAVVYELSRMFGNSGWFDGEMGELVGAVVDLLVRDEEPSCNQAP